MICVFRVMFSSEITLISACASLCTLFVCVFVAFSFVYIRVLSYVVSRFLVFVCVFLLCAFPFAPPPPARPPSCSDAVVSRVRPFQADGRVRRPHGRPLFRVLQGVPRGM